LSLRARLVASTVSAVALALGVGFVWARQNLHDLLVEQVDEVLVNKYRELAAVAGGSLNALEKELEREIEVYERIEMTVYIDLGGGRTLVAPNDRDGRRIANRLAGLPDDGLNRTLPDVDGLPPLRVHLAKSLKAGDQTVPVAIAVSLDRSYATLQSFDRRVLLGGLTLLAIAVPVGFWLYRQALRPVTTALKAAKRLDPKELSARLPESGSGDEFDQLAKLINELLAKLERHHSRVTKFTADASHELRTPLAAMRAAIDVALQSANLGDDQQNMLASLGDQCDRLTAVVEKLQLLARADAGRLQPKREPVDLAALTSETLDFLAPLAEDRSLSVHRTLGANAVVDGDPSYLRQVIVNLMDNALKFTPGEGAVDVSVTVNQNRVALTVADSGPGVPVQELESLFERFYRSDAARSQRGSGLGLSICRSIVEAHGGEISAANRPSGGGVFTVTLPRSARANGSSSL